MTFAYSERRRLLDLALDEFSALITGTVVEVGAGQASRRGRFRLPTEQMKRRWSVDVTAAVRPDVVGDVEALPLRHSSADTVLSLEVLEYVPRPHVALAEMHRVLRANGHLLLSVPFVHRMDSASDRWRFSENGLRDALGSAGFSVLALRPQGFLFSAIAHLICSAVAQRPRRLDRWLFLVVIWPFVALAHFEGRRKRGGTERAGATTGYLVIARK